MMKLSKTGSLMVLSVSMMIAVVLFMLSLGMPWSVVVQCFVWHSFQDYYSITEWIIKAIPLMILAVGLNYGARAKYFNLGAEGQMVMAAIGVSAVALSLGDYPNLSLALMIVVGVGIATIYGLIPYVLKTYLSINEILSSLILNYIAYNLLNGSLMSFLKASEGSGAMESDFFPEGVLLQPLMEGSRLHVGIVFGLLFAGFSYLVFKFTRWGFMIDILGQSVKTARFADLPIKRLMLTVVFASGIGAGMSIVFELLALQGQLIPNITNNYGFTAVIVYFLGGFHFLGIILASLFISFTYMVGECSQLNGFSVGFGLVIQGLLFLWVILYRGGRS